MITEKVTAALLPTIYDQAGGSSEPGTLIVIGGECEQNKTTGRSHHNEAIQQYSYHMYIRRIANRERRIENRGLRTGSKITWGLGVEWSPRLPSCCRHRPINWILMKQGISSIHDTKVQYRENRKTDNNSTSSSSAVPARRQTRLRSTNSLSQRRRHMLHHPSWLLC